MGVSENTVLVEIITQAQMAGVEQAKAGFAGFNPSVLALGASAAVLGGMLKSVFDNEEAQQAATRNLAQAYGYLKEAIPTQEIQDFIDKNASFLPSMYAAENGFAALARAGFNNTTQLRLMNDALDLSVALSIPLDQAISDMTKGSLGLSRGLLDLGISQKDINAALGKGATESQKFAALLLLLEPKIKTARQDSTDLSGATNRLNLEWETLNKNGQPLPATIQFVEDKLTDLLKFLSTSQDMNGPNGFFADLQNTIIVTVGLVELLIGKLRDLVGEQQYKTMKQTHKPGSSHPSLRTLTSP